MPTEDEVLEDTVAFISGTSYDELPDASIRTAERCFIDTIGVIYPGAAKSAGGKAGAMGAALGTDGPTPILGAGTAVGPLDAAFVNGTAAHGLDFDDSQGAIPGHPSGVIVPVLLSATHFVEATGRDAIAAYAVGFEVEHFVGQAIYPSHYDHGWHANGTLGTFGAVAAASHYLGLEEDEIRQALNIVSSMPAGVRANFGTDTKPMHSGQAARSGLTAALLAREGFTGGANAFAGDHGFFDVYAGAKDPDFDALPELDGRALETVGVDVKKYACAHPQHGCMGAASQLVEEHDIDPDAIEGVHLLVSGIADEACRYDDPQTGLEGKFSLPYTVASAIVLDRVTLETFEDEGVANPDVQAIREKVTYERDPDMPYRSFGGTVRITTEDGSTYEKTLEYPPGAHENPLTLEELREKFTMCAEYSDLEDPDAVFEVLDDLRSQDDMADVVDLFR